MYIIPLLLILVWQCSSSQHTYTHHLPPPQNDNKITEIQTNVGPIQGIQTYVGKLNVSHESEHVWQFLGIPFAEPPINHLRWMRPQPLQPFTDPYPAFSYGKGCAQKKGPIPLDSTGFSEDCLFLNIFVPVLPKSFPDPFQKSKSSEKMPVIFLIHGGAFAHGSSHLPPFHHPDRTSILSKSIVITFNYRLGALGFLYHPEMDPLDANPGFQDQIAALSWVHSNIEHFGGDPTKINVLGFSAGAFSACEHLVSPLSRHYINSVTLISGHCYSVPPANQYNFALGELFQIENDCDSLECLKKLPAHKVQSDFPTRKTPFFHTGYSWAPILDGTILSDLSFNLLQETKDESKLRQTNHKAFVQRVQERSIYPFTPENLPSSPIRLLAGNTLNEGSVFSVAAFPIVFSSDYVHNLFHASFPLGLSSATNVKEVQQLSRKYNWKLNDPKRHDVIEVYENDPDFLKLPVRQQMETMIGDYAFTCPTRRTVLDASRIGIPSKMFIWSYRSSVWTISRIKGVYHGAEEPLFYHRSNWSMMKGTLSLSEQQFSHQFIENLGQFAAGDTELDKQWPDITPDSISIKVWEINNPHIRTVDLKEQHCSLWDAVQARAWFFDHPCNHMPNVKGCKNKDFTSVDYYQNISPETDEISVIHNIKDFEDERGDRSTFSPDSPCHILSPGIFALPVPIPIPKSTLLLNTIIVELYKSIKSLDVKSLRIILWTLIGLIFVRRATATWQKNVFKKHRFIATRDLKGLEKKLKKSKVENSNSSSSSNSRSEQAALLRMQEADKKRPTSLLNKKNI